MPSLGSKALYYSTVAIPRLCSILAEETYGGNVSWKEVIVVVTHPIHPSMVYLFTFDSQILLGVAYVHVDAILL